MGLSLQGEVIVGTFKPVNRRDRMPPAAQQPTATAGVADAAALNAGAGSDTEKLGRPLEQQQGEQREDVNAPGSGRVHKPKVATWGVFPRPQNISEAYGGGCLAALAGGVLPFPRACLKPAKMPLSCL